MKKGSIPWQEIDDSNVIMSMLESEEQGGRWICVVHDKPRGSPQITVLTVNVFATKEEGLAWFEEVQVTQPWRPRS